MRIDCFLDAQRAQQHNSLHVLSFQDQSDEWAAFISYLEAGDPTVIYRLVNKIMLVLSLLFPVASSYLSGRCFNCSGTVFKKNASLMFNLMLISGVMDSC